MGSEHKDRIEGSVTSPRPAPGAVEMRAQAAHPSIAGSAPAAASASSPAAAAANPLKPKLTKQNSSLTTFVERRSHGLRASLLHALPMALIQTCDFVSDCLVVFGEFRTHPAMLGQYHSAVFFMALSLVGAWLWIFIRLRGRRHKLVAALLAPVNLHTLYIGGLFATYDSDGNNKADDLDGGLEEEAVFHATIAMLNDKADGWSARPSHSHNRRATDRPSYAAGLTVSYPTSRSSPRWPTPPAPRCRWSV